MYSRFLTEIPNISKATLTLPKELHDYNDTIDWEYLIGEIDDSKVDVTVPPISDEFLPPSGPDGAITTFNSFVDTKLKYYGDKRNDPNLDLQSGLSPYLRFG